MQKFLHVGLHAESLLSARQSMRLSASDYSQRHPLTSSLTVSSLPSVRSLPFPPRPLYTTGDIFLLSPGDAIKDRMSNPVTLTMTGTE